MNICLLTSTFLPGVGGLEIVVHNLATALADLGHNIYLVTPFKKEFRDARYDYNYQVIKFGFRGHSRLKLTPLCALKKLKQVVRKYHIDVINAHNVFSAGTWAYRFQKYNKNVAIIGTPHGDDIQITPEINDGRRLNPMFDQLIRRNLAAFDIITSISPSIRDDLDDLVEDKSKIVDIPNGIWMDQFKRDEGWDRNIQREKYGIPKDSIVLISIGRNHPRKGFQYGLKAVAKLKREGYNVAYLLVGRDMDPIIKKGHSMGLSSCLITPGQVATEKIADLLKLSDIYLSPSIVESFGVATLEAMGAGLPCVVTDIAGSRDLVKASYGKIVTSKDSEAMSVAIKYLIDNPDIRKKMSYKAKIEADEYDWPQIANLYISAYHAALNCIRSNTNCSN
jgi:glycosyltransferase involved in cell wall biosynthesis